MGCLRLWRRWGSGRSGNGSRMARAPELSRLRARGPKSTGRLAVGFHGSSLVRVEARHSIAGVGQTQSGKSAGLEIPNIVEWDGCAVVSSAKDDLLRVTEGCRRRVGEVLIFDPFGLTGRSHTWSPHRGVLELG